MCPLPWSRLLLMLGTQVPNSVWAAAQPTCSSTEQLPRIQDQLPTPGIAFSVPHTLSPLIFITPLQ